MIQDIEPKRFSNEYTEKEISAESKVLIFQNRSVLIRRNEDDTLQLPSYEELSEIQGITKTKREEMFQYIFSIDQEDFFLWKNFKQSGYDFEEEFLRLTGYDYENIRALRQMISKDVCFSVMSAYHLYVWYCDNRFCGRCGSRTQHDKSQRMLFCPNCKNMIFPKIAPAVIVGLVHGDKILMSKYADRDYKKYALLAGFTEFGETAEDTVRREVFEEVGLHVKHIKYYKSQPWGMDSNLLLGYFAELTGEEDIRIDRSELALAEWHSRDNMPAIDDGISLTREMMGFFQDAEAFEAWYQS